MGSVASQRNLSWPSMPSMPSIPFWGSNSSKTAQEANSSPEKIAAESSTAAADQANPQAVPVDNATPLPAETANPNPGLDAISELVNNQQSAAEILSREEGIGYLSSLGLDFGWGPSSLMQWTLEHVHVWTGLGWAGSIVATAILFRIVMFYPTVQGTKLAANMKKMQDDPRHKELNEKLKAGIRNGDREAQQTAQALAGLLRKEYDAPATGIIWNLLPIPFSFGMFRVVSGMTHIPVPSLEWSGMWWFTDLTRSDPFFILPAIATALMVFSIKRNAANSPKSQSDMANKMVYVLGPVMLIGTSFLSAAVNLMGLAFGAATLATTLLLNTASVRRFMGIPPLQKPQAPKLSYSAPRGVITAEAAGEAGKLPPKPPASWKQSIQDSVNYAKEALDKQTQKLPGQGNMEDRAERRRREELKRKEDERRNQERAAFDAKYKRKGKK